MKDFAGDSFESNESSYIVPSELPLSPLSRISPSKLHLFRECRLRACLESNRANVLLPLSPTAHCGTVIHRVLEMAVKDNEDGSGGFEECWRKSLEIENNKMKNSWLERHFVPLEESVPKYDLKKHQCSMLIKNIMKSKAIAKKKLQHKGFRRESWLETRDKIAGGFIDAIISTSRGDIIVDYKTGNIYEASHGNKLDIKKLYKDQLKLYAAIYNSAFGVWPASLQIAGIDGVLHEIDFDKDDCICLLDEVRQVWNDVNSVISDEGSLSQKNTKLSSSSPEICRYCLYRPGCRSYAERKDKHPNLNWPNDVAGTIKEKKILKNGLALVKIETKNKYMIIVRGLHPNRHPALNMDSKELAIFSMILDGNPNHYKEGPLTTIYIIS